MFNYINILMNDIIIWANKARNAGSNNNDKKRDNLSHANAR